ncbi:ras and EF-hand domain-containing protein homolog isoform X1 [Drosophila mojavensis]|uniref:Uncharacterized protein, isoform B n=1 Tax=Drosophila mojavensis TaxID=7230 RepID=B4KQK6_DROMO|nr:ras and EF-hand domain-containing protein homolog isoform X1 [Drosophila mojavensis]EDW08175.2 uncharacterized protein Dmoj_GI19816, isoform B [Drosophila mojavensis]
MQKADKQAKAEQAQTGKSKAKAKEREKVKRDAATSEAEGEGKGGAEAAVGGATAEQDLELESPKAKARSRFSAAFRSLKTKKQEKEKPKPSSAEQLTAISSGEAEDLTSLGEISLDSGLKSSQKKKSLTRRLLLGSLKPKTKERPHSLATSDELSLKSSSSGRERERERALGTGLGSSSTLKITISGKKVETVEVKGRSETDYLTPIPTQTATEEATAATATATVKPATTAATATATKETAKLIVAKVVSKEQSKLKKQSKQTKQPKQQLRAAPQIEEKIVITESRRDTPPRERAPAKPSRASSNQSANSAGEQHKSSSASKALSLPSREKRALMQQQQLQQQQQQRGHRLNKGSNTAALEKEALVTPPSSELQPAPPPASSTPELSPSSAPTSSTLVLVSPAESLDAVSLAESAQTSVAPVVRFAVGSAVRGPDAYELALAAAANQQPSSSEEPSDSSLRRLSFKQQLALSDHDSIEGRRETVRYQSVASEYGEDQDTGDEQELDRDSKPMPAFGNLTMDQEMEPTIMSPSGEKREHLYKILVIGELGTGKTSFIKRYVHQFFSQNYRATIGVDFALKVLHWDANTIVRLQLWDIAGQERFGNMTRVYYKEAVGAFIVFDVTRSGTFDCVSKWKEDLDSKVQLPDGSPIPCILLANKCDQEKQGIVTQPERMDEYVRENGFAGWFETSAKENINIDEAARALVNKILINDKLITADANDAEKFNLSAADASAETKNKCSC